MNVHKLAKRYAKALFQLAKEQGILEKIDVQVKSLHALVGQSPEFAQYLENPVIPAETKKDILSKIFEKRLHPPLSDFLNFLIDKERLEYLSDICACFIDLFAENQGILEVTVKSFCHLSKAQVEHISAKLKDYFKKEIIVHAQEDKGLLGGFQIQVKDLIYDLSIKSQLARFYQSVITV